MGVVRRVEGVEIISFCKFCKSSGKKSGICVTCLCSTGNISVSVLLMSEICHSSYREIRHPSRFSLFKLFFPLEVPLARLIYLLMEGKKKKTVRILKVVSGKKKIKMTVWSAGDSVVENLSLEISALPRLFQHQQLHITFYMLQIEANNTGNFDSSA